MKVVPCAISDVLLFTPRVFADERGVFLETYNEHALDALGFHYRFVQDNLSVSKCNVVRGLHYQIQQPQGKLVRVIFGEVLDVAVDLRRWSPSFGSHVAVRLSDKNYQGLWIPPGLAHGFAVLSERAHVLYKTTDFYAPECERTILWNDRELGISWPMTAEQAIVSGKDKQGVSFANAEMFEDEASLQHVEQAL